MPIVITEKNKLVLEALATYYVLSRSMIQKICFPHVRSSRAVCERLRKLKTEGYISQASMEVVLRGQNAVPVYYPNKKTCETLAAIYDDAAYENVYSKPPSGRLLFHWLEISQMHRVIDRAIAASPALTTPAFFNEWETINKDERNPRKRFSLYTEFDKGKPPLSCAPDAGFLLEKAGHRKVFYLEVDRGTDGIRRICSKKPKGYARLALAAGHRKHFANTSVKDFAVLFITTTRYRRDELVKRFEKLDGASLWKFAYRGDVTQDTFFAAPIWYSILDGPKTLVRNLSTVDKTSKAS